jgi:hypothetical protein
VRPGTAKAAAMAGPARAPVSAGPAFFLAAPWVIAAVHRAWFPGVYKTSPW